jgi:hypothetical protein
MSFGIKSTEAAQGALQESKVNRGLPKMASGERIASAGDEAASFAVAVTTEARGRSHKVATPTPTEAPHAAQLDGSPPAVTESAQRAADQIQARAQIALQAQFNAQKATALKLLG